jgi:hypothetical protein
VPRQVFNFLLGVAVCVAPATQAPPSVSGAECAIAMHDVTANTGITFRHTDGSSGRYYIIESVSAGLALFDYDDDGDVDIFFLNGAPLPGKSVPMPPVDALYRNDGNFHFTDVTRAAGLADRNFGLGVAVADYDNDGDQDLYLNNFGPKVLFQNNGDGTFTDVTKTTGGNDGEKVGAGACFLDVEADGDLDLFVGNYVKFSFDKHVPSYTRGIPWYTGPWVYPPETSTLFRNNGDGTMSDVGRESGIASAPGSGMGAISFDYDEDGDSDIAVGNDVRANFLWANDGKGRFHEVGLLAGFAYNGDGEARASMGVDAGDFNNDGRLDLFVTNYQGELPVLYQNLGGGLLADVTLKTGAGAGSLPHIKWGTGLVDFDNDGDRDIFIACGHIQDQVHKVDSTTSYHAKNILLMNNGKGRFTNVSNQCGDGLQVQLSSRGAAFDDLDNDGDVDAVIVNSRREPTILRNDSKTGNHWLEIRLIGTQCNRSAVGARVKVVSGELSQVSEVHSGRSYQSHFGSRLHFGLGTRARIDRIEVRWLGGQVDVFTNVDADQLLTVTQGQRPLIEAHILNVD